MIINSDVTKRFFYLFCLLIPFENTALSGIGGVFTASLGVVLIPFFLLFLLLNIKHVRRYELKVGFGFFLFYLYSFIMLFFYIGDYQNSFLIDRGVRFSLIVLAPIIVFLVCIRQTEEVLSRGAILIFMVVCFSYILNLVNRDLVNTTSFFQSTPALSPHRMRGFTLEASHFGFQLVVSSLLFLSVVLRNKVLPIFLLIVATYFVTSKGTLLSLMIVVPLAFLIVARVRLDMKLYVLLSMLIFVAIFSSDSIYSMFETDIEKYNSVATRAAVLTAAILSVVFNPFGAGFFGFLPSIYENGNLAITILDNAFPSMLNFTEFSLYLVVGSVEGVSTKSFFFNWLIYGGLLFLYFYMKLIIPICRNIIAKRNYYDISLFLFLLITTSTFITIESRYIAPFALAFLYKRAYSKQ